VRDGGAKEFVDRDPAALVGVEAGCFEVERRRRSLTAGRVEDDIRGNALAARERGELRAPFGVLVVIISVIVNFLIVETEF
jgi:hypothetical protein